MPDQYVWLTWCGIFLCCWSLLYFPFPRLRRVQWQVSLCTMPFGLTEPLFLGDYWNPPSLFHLARIAHVDIESFLFCFSIGGIAAVLYNAVSGQPLGVMAKMPRHMRHQQWNVFLLLFPALSYLLLLAFMGHPLWAGIAVMMAGALARVVKFTPLRRKTIVGGLLFFAGYVILFWLLLRLFPGYVARVWSRHVYGGFTLGIPRAEMLFGLSFGLFWSGLYEQLRWTFTVCCSKPVAGAQSSQPLPDPPGY